VNDALPHVGINRLRDGHDALIPVPRNLLNGRLAIHPAQHARRFFIIGVLGMQFLQNARALMGRLNVGVELVPRLNLRGNGGDERTNSKVVSCGLNAADSLNTNAP
jgi:hypothetical protein